MGNDDYTITISSDNVSTSLLDTVTIDTSYTNDTGSEYTFNTNADYSTTITGATVGGCIDTTYTIDGLDNVYDIDEIDHMCEEYPALKTAYEKFRTIYKMTLQDWKGKQNDE